MVKNHPGLFKDLGKRANDLLTKDFPSEKGENKLEWKGEADYNVTLQTSLVSKRDGTVGTFTPKYKHKEWDTTFSAEITTDKDVKVEVVTEDLLNFDGLKTTVTGNSKGKDRFAEFAIEYKHDMATVTGSVDYGKTSGSTIKSSAVIGSQGLALGASTEYLIGRSESELKELKTVLAYGNDDFDITASGTMKQNQGKNPDKNELAASYFHKVNSGWLVGAQTTFDTSNSDAKPSLVFATQYRVQPDTVVKAKMGTDGKLGLSFSQKYNKFAQINISSTVDTNSLGGKNSSTFGFTLSLND